nr:protein T27B7.1 [imported] - Caenorhabditis elegans [Caenorhabditis elegans]
MHPDSSRKLALKAVVNQTFCQVCGQESHGAHFGAITCRACAAFFRRVAAGANFEVKCKDGRGRCKILTNGRSCCKKCRLKKCKDIGMDIQNFQFNRDSFATSTKVAPSLSTFLGRPEFLLSCSPGTSASTSQNKFIDLSPFIKNCKQVLMDDRKIPLAPGKTRLQKLSSSLDFEISANNKKKKTDLRKVSTLGFSEAIQIFENELLMTSKWLAHFEEFHDLGNDFKVAGHLLNQNLFNFQFKFLECTWNIWNRLERVARTAALLRDQKISNGKGNEIILARNCVIDLRTVKFEVEWFTNYSLSEISYFIEGVGDWSMNKPLQAIIDFNPTEIELNFMLAQISLTCASKQMDSQYQETIDNLQKLIAD